MNLCANDGQRLYEALLHAAFAVSAIPVIGASIYAVHLLGPWGIFGFVVFFAFIPFQVSTQTLVFILKITLIKNINGLSVNSQLLCFVNHLLYKKNKKL